MPKQTIVLCARQRMIRFEVYYKEWGCLSSIVALITMKGGTAVNAHTFSELRSDLPEAAMGVIEYPYYAVVEIPGRDSNLPSLLGMLFAGGCYVAGSGSEFYPNGQYEIHTVFDNGAFQEPLFPKIETEEALIELLEQLKKTS